MSNRFIFDDYAIRPQSSGNLLAYVNVIDTVTGLEFRDLRLMNGRNGVFLSPPSRSYENKDGETKYAEYYRVAYIDDERSEAGQQLFDEMTEAAYAEYEQRNAAAETAAPRAAASRGSSRGASRPAAPAAPARGASRGAARSAAPAARSGRGPVGRGGPPRVDEGGDEVKDLPF